MAKSFLRDFFYMQAGEKTQVQEKKRCVIQERFISVRSLTPFSGTKGGGGGFDCIPFLFFGGGGRLPVIFIPAKYIQVQYQDSFPGYVIYRKISVNQRKKLDICCLGGRFHFHARDDSSLVTASCLEFNSMHFLKNGSN